MSTASPRRPSASRRASACSDRTAGPELARLVRLRLLGGEKEQRAAIGPAEHAREAAASGRDPVGDVSAGQDTDALAAQRVRRPYGAVGVEADAVRDVRRELGED